MEPRLIKRNRVHVALDHDHLFDRLRPFELFQEIDVVERFALIEHHGLLGVFILGKVGFFEQSSAEPHHLVKGVDDGKDQPSALRIDKSAVFRLRQHAAVEQVLLRIAPAREIFGQGIEIERRAEAEFLDRRRRELPP